MTWSALYLYYKVLCDYYPVGYRILLHLLKIINNRFQSRKLQFKVMDKMVPLRL